MPKVSVIVPVYRAERCLDRCINSILKQSFADFELLLVDDGSPDTSGAICERYAEKDGRIQVLHKENGGVSSARNAGLDAASGRYILFVDSDDYILEDYIETLYENRSDMTVCGMSVFDERGKLLREVKHTPVNYKNRETIDYAALYGNNMLYSPYCRLLRRSIIETMGVRFPSGVNWGEDGMFVADYLQAVNEVAVLDYVGYCYVKYDAENSLSTRVRSDIVETVCFARGYCIEKMKTTSPAAYQAVSEVCTEDMRRNCASFVKRTLHSKKIRRRRKKKLLEGFLENAVVRQTWLERQKYYPGIVVEEICARAILHTCRKSVMRNKLISCYDALPEGLKKTCRNIKRCLGHDS